MMKVFHDSACFEIKKTADIIYFKIYKDQYIKEYLFWQRFDPVFFGMLINFFLIL